MTNAISIPRKLIVLAIVAPLAAILGYMLSDPMEERSMVFVLAVVSILCIPIVLKWHHPLLVLSWNTGLLVFFLPGQPQLWMLLCLISFGVSVLTFTLNKEQKPLHVPAVTWSLIALCVVVLITAKLTGGLGVRALGGNVYGGKKYYTIFFAVIAYFALSMKSIPPERARLYAAFFFLGGLAPAFSNLIYFAGPNFYFLYLFFPSEHAFSQAMEDLQVDFVFSRLSGMAWTGLAAFSYMHMRFGVRGIFDLTKPWRLIVYLLVIALSLLGGFRSVIVVYSLILLTQYLVEGLWRTKYTVHVFLAGAVAVVMVVLFASKLPMSVQRSLSIIPGVEVHQRAREDARSSLDWRFRMWRLLVPEIPKHFWLGKGYTATAADYYLAMESARRGFSEDVEISLTSGDYHNGPLSVIVPFGIWGVLAFGAFLIAGFKVLKANLKYGTPELHRVNVFLYALFIARTIFYLVFFGAINSDLVYLAGIVALSVSINGGMRKPELAATRAENERAELAAAGPDPLTVGRIRWRG